MSATLKKTLNGIKQSVVEHKWNEFYNLLVGVLASDSGSAPKCSFQDSIEALYTRQHVSNCVPAIVIKGGCLERQHKHNNRE